MLFLHGLGENANAWDKVTSLCDNVKGITPDLFNSKALTESWTLIEATEYIASQITKPIHIVGLSLGAVIGFDIAIRYPHLVKSLFLSAPQAKAPRLLMSVQRLFMQVLPASLVCPPDMEKRELLGVLDSLSNLDFTPLLPTIMLPTTILCGSKDWANLSAARAIAKTIPQANLEIVPKAKHQWHTAMPEQFSQHLIAHLES